MMEEDLLSRCLHDIALARKNLHENDIEGSIEKTDTGVRNLRLDIFVKNLVLVKKRRSREKEIKFRLINGDSYNT
jgi:hypothetical protein